MVRGGMMLLGLLLAGSAWASDVGLQFKEITPAKLVEGVVKGVLGRDYIMSPDVAGMASPLTISVKSTPRENVLPLLRSTLATVGVRLEDRDGVVFVDRGQSENRAPGGAPVSPLGDAVPHPDPESKPKEPEREVYTYFPRYRSPEFLEGMVRLVGCHVPGSSTPQAVPFLGAPIMGGVVQQQAPVQPAPSPSSAATKRSDVLVYACSDAKQEKLLKLFDQVDRPVGVVNVRAVVLEYSLGEESTRSISAVFNLLKGKLGLTYSAGAQVGNSLTLTGASLSAVLSAVDGDSRFRSVSEPNLRVADGETAKLIVGQDVPVRSQVSQDRNGNAFQSVEYKSSGVILTLEPRLYRDSIMMKIGHQVSSYTVTTTSQIDSPTLRKREAQTTVTAAPGDLIVIGGMDSTEETANTSGLSFLPKWMHGTTGSNSRSQILLMMEVTRDVAI